MLRAGTCTNLWLQSEAFLAHSQIGKLLLYVSSYVYEVCQSTKLAPSRFLSYSIWSCHFANRFLIGIVVPGVGAGQGLGFVLERGGGEGGEVWCKGSDPATVDMHLKTFLWDDLLLAKEPICLLYQSLSYPKVCSAVEDWTRTRLAGSFSSSS